MINLLPSEREYQIRFGRKNSVLRSWLIGAGIAICGMVLIILGGTVYINQQSKNLQKNIDNTKGQLAAQNLSKVQADATEISSDVKVINEVLNREVRYSDLIQAIGRVIPPGTALSGLTLANINGSIDLTVNAHDRYSATQVTANLNDPDNGLFSKVDTLSVNCTSTPAIPVYPCTASFRALFNPATSTKFLGVPKESGQ